MEQGVKRSATDPCVFTKDTNSDVSLIVAVFVDDIVTCSPSLAVIKEFKALIGSRFKMTPR